MGGEGSCPAWTSSPTELGRLDSIRCQDFWTGSALFGSVNPSFSRQMLSLSTVTL